VRNIQTAHAVQPRRCVSPPAMAGQYPVVYGRLSNDRMCPNPAIATPDELLKRMEPGPSSFSRGWQRSAERIAKSCSRWAHRTDKRWCACSLQRLIGLETCCRATKPAGDKYRLKPSVQPQPPDGENGLSPCSGNLTVDLLAHL
jgi:hypothetical protein